MTTAPHAPQPLMTTEQAAAFLGVSPRTMERWRLTGAGPVFRRIVGRVRYQLADLEAFAGENAGRSVAEAPVP